MKRSMATNAWISRSPRWPTGSCWRGRNRVAGRAPAPHHRPRMAEEPIALHRAEARPPARNPNWGGSVWTAAKVRFDRIELNRILTLYGRMVAAGEWRDYAIDFLDDRAVF